MIRLAVSVEGVTEEEFVKESLAPHSERKDVYVTPVLIGRARRHVRGGGNVSIERLASEMRHLSGSFDAVTSLVDFYGLRGKGNKLPSDLVQAIRNRIGHFDDQSGAGIAVQIDIEDAVGVQHQIKELSETVEESL